MIDKHGDRMKAYEALADPNVDVATGHLYARLDGRGFSKFTKGMKRPFDSAMTEAMVATMAGLVDKFNANIGYTQSDEISLHFDTTKHVLPFNGRQQKIVSSLAATATALFTMELFKHDRLRSYVNRMPTFDCRICILPEEEIVNMFTWRFKDATRNAISSAARSKFSHKALQNKNTIDKLDMLSGKDVCFDDYPDSFKSGTFASKITVIRPLSDEDKMRIPEKYWPENGLIERNEVGVYNIPSFVDYDFKTRSRIILSPSECTIKPGD